MFSPRVDDVKYSCSDRCRILRVEIWVSFEKLQPWMIEKQLSDKRLQVILHQHKNKQYFGEQELRGCHLLQ